MPRIRDDLDEEGRQRACAAATDWSSEERGENARVHHAGVGTGARVVALEPAVAPARRRCRRGARRAPPASATRGNVHCAGRAGGARGSRRRRRDGGCTRGVKRRQARAVALLVERTPVGAELGALDVETAVARERGAVASHARRRDAVEQIDAAAHALDEILGEADAHEVARAIVRAARASHDPRGCGTCPASPRRPTARRCRSRSSRPCRGSRRRPRGAGRRGCRPGRWGRAPARAGRESDPRAPAARTRRGSARASAGFARSRRARRPPRSGPGIT